MPARAAPTSLAGQLRFIRATWAGILGASLDGAHRRARPRDRRPGRGGARASPAVRWRRRGGGHGPGRGDRRSAAAADEPEAFSSDSAWMPRVVLIAKSTYVWLDQLSRAYGRDIRTLDAIPDEELDTLARWGVTGLWLIGLWERSSASERIKRMRGNAGCGRLRLLARRLPDRRRPRRRGPPTRDLRDRAWARGIRLASDMVPNHMGIDSSWVIEHPEWFLSLDEPPYPGLHVRRARPVVRPAGRDRPRGPLLGRQRRRGRVQAVRPPDRRRPATSTTATTGRASRGTTPRSSTSSTPPSANR